MKYVADDGTPFDTEKECAEYEEKLAKKYVVRHNGKETIFSDETSAKRFIADRLHDCYNDGIVRSFEFERSGKTRGFIVEFDSDEVAEFVPAHYKISSEKFDKIFQLSAKKVKIPGYTLHGDYYLSDNVIINTTWEDACKMRQIIDLPNGKKVLAHTLSKEELESVPKEERRTRGWYWTSSPYDGKAWYVGNIGIFYFDTADSKDYIGGARLGFKNPF